MDELWGGDWFGSTKTFYVHVGRLRRRIGAGTGVDGHITTIRRVGFRFATEDDLALSPRRPPAGGREAAAYRLEQEKRSSIRWRGGQARDMIAGVVAAADRPALAGTFGAAAGAASPRDCGGVKTSWLRAVGLAAFMLLASYLLFVLVPNNLLSYLSLHASPRNRDLLVSLWWVLAFGFGCWLFVRLQQTKAR